jgi:hypothetical protein
MKDGIYFVDFESSQGRSGSGIFVVSQNAFNGGDHAYTYQGQMKETGNKISTTIHVSCHNDEINSVFGTTEDFDLDCSGTWQQNHDEFSLTGEVPGQPQLKISVNGYKLRDLV